MFIRVGLIGKKTVSLYIYICYKFYCHKFFVALYPLIYESHINFQITDTICLFTVCKLAKLFLQNISCLYFSCLLYPLKLIELQKTLRNWINQTLRYGDNCRKMFVSPTLLRLSIPMKLMGRILENKVVDQSKGEIFWRQTAETKPKKAILSLSPR